MHPVARAAVEFAAARALFRSDDRVALALSGGPDSCALLLALIEASDAGFVPRPIAVFHFHHGMRGDEADADAVFCESFAATFGLTCDVGHGKLGASTNEGAARTARYDFLIDAARKAGANIIATAHTADDQVETLLLRVLRGTSVAGLAGIPPRRPLTAEIDVVRPLLSVRRAEIEAYCAARDVIPRHDPTNDNLRYPRNRLRRLLPELADAFNPRLVEAIGRLADNAAADATLLEALAGDLARRTQRADGALDRAALASAPAALRRRVLLRALRQAGGRAREELLTAEWVAALERLLEAPGRIDLPGGLHAETSRRSLWILILGKEAWTPFDRAVPVPGSVALPGGRLVASEGSPPQAAEREPFSVRLRSGDFALRVRSVRPGDRMAPQGRDGRTRPVRELLAEADWPASRRERAAAVVRTDTGEILWLIGVRVSESARPREEGSPTVFLAWQPAEGNPESSREQGD